MLKLHQNNKTQRGKNCQFNDIYAERSNCANTPYATLQIKIYGMVNSHQKMRYSQVFFVILDIDYSKIHVHNINNIVGKVSSLHIFCALLIRYDNIRLKSGHLMNLF